MWLSANIGCTRIAGPFIELAALLVAGNCVQECERDCVALCSRGALSCLRAWQLVGNIGVNQRLCAELDARPPLDPIAFSAVRTRRAATRKTRLGSATKPNSSQPSDAYHLTAVALPPLNGEAGRIYAFSDGGKVECVARPAIVAARWQPAACPRAENADTLSGMLAQLLSPPATQPLRPLSQSHPGCWPPTG